jgi:hypothetical protein
VLATGLLGNRLIHWAMLEIALIVPIDCVSELLRG